MNASAQISLYPLRQQALSPAIDAVRRALHSEGIAAQVGPMSTIATGEASRLFAALEKAFEEAASGGHVVMVVTVSNACPMPVQWGAKSSMGRKILVRQAQDDERWYETPRGRKASWAEKALLSWLLDGFPDPDDEAIVFALRCTKHEFRGTYAVAFGPGIDPLDAAMVRRLARPSAAALASQRARED